MKRIIKFPIQKIFHKYSLYTRIKMIYQSVAAILHKNKKNKNLKLLQLIYTENRGVICIIQLFGANQQAFLNIKKIISDKKIYDNFDSRDQSILMWAAGFCEYKIISIDIASSSPIFTVQANCKNQTYIKNFTSFEITKNRKLINKLPYHQKILIATIMSRYENSNFCQTM